MIVCHCNQITDHDIRTAVDWMRAADASVVITPGKVWRTLGKRPDCASCVPLLVEKMAACDSLAVDIPVLRTPKTRVRKTS